MSADPVPQERRVVHSYEIDGFKSDVFEDEVRLQKDPARSVATITLSRPDSLNSLTVAGWDYVAHLIRQCDRDDDVKVIVIQGDGEHFTTGGDARDLGRHVGFEPGKKPSQRRRFVPNRETTMGFSSVIEAVARSVKVTLVKVRGYCYGNGLQIALAADFVVSSETGWFAHPAWRYLGPLFNYAHLVEAIGIRKAKEIMFTTRALDAHEAEQCGMITRCVPDDELDRWVDDYVDAISVQPLDGIVMGKAMIEMVMDARGFAAGTHASVVGHTWMSNLQFQPEEWNFVKARTELGLKGALKQREDMVAPFFRQSRKGSGNGKKAGEE